MKVGIPPQVCIAAQKSWVMIGRTLVGRSMSPQP